MVLARPLSVETISLMGVGAAFAGAAVFLCVAAYNAGQTKLPPSTVHVASLSPWLPPALPAIDRVQEAEENSAPMLTPAPEPTSVFAPPSDVEVLEPPVRLKSVRPPPLLPSSAPNVLSSAPMPPPRPIDVNPGRPTPTPTPTATATATATPASPSLALAPRPSLSDIGVRPASLGQYDQFTAVYDLSAHTVYLPGGEKLEAHSGLGALKDDPGHVDQADRGATPPHLYDLTLRESLFHGVQALRLNPHGGSDSIFGRAGLLAHTYMLGAGGDSNGCVSFKDYDAFLQAFQTGRVKRLAVVAAVR